MNYQSNFSFDGNKVLTAEEFAQFTATDKGLRAARYPFNYTKTNGEAAAYINWAYNDVRDLSPEQMENARQRYEQKRDEIRREYDKPGTLFVVCLGSDIPKSNPDDVANHRAHVLFIDSAGDLRSVEFHPAGAGFTFDRANHSERERQEKEYQRKEAENVKKYGKNGWVPFDERPAVPISLADRGTVQDLPFTTGGLVAWFEREHGVKFTRVFIDRHFFASHEITSRAK